MAVDPHLDLDQEIAWPSKLRSLHGEGADWTQTACLGWSHGDAYTRIRGFRVAAELIAAHVAEHRGDQDGLIFPFLSNWRQHIEVAMKELIVDSERLRDVTGKKPFGHNLNDLWSRCRASFEALGQATTDELENVGLAIAELHAMDPYGDAFRYARSRDGKATLPGVDRLSFEQINEAFVAVANFLEAADTAISVDLENKLDFEREYAAEADWY